MKIAMDVVIIGGGLAGLMSGIHLSKLGIKVVIIEKNDFPKHKVCGEYISNEVLPYFNWLGIEIRDLKPSKITKMEFSTSSGRAISSDLPLGGFGISRYELDYYLSIKAIQNGCQIIQDTATDIQFIDDEFFVTTLDNLKLKSKILIGAFGKRSTIDQKLNRNFIFKKSPWLAVKAHYSGDFPNDLVGLHNFKGGYCGVSKIENNKINICYLVDYVTFKQHKNIEEFQSKIICKNPHLKHVFENSILLFDKPLTISQISFEKKAAVENHILMVGDTAGLIHPLCGNGMAMAIHSAKIASELVSDFLNHKISSRKELEKKYTQVWNINFKNRLASGRLLAKILRNEKVATFIMKLMIRFTFIVPLIIKQTHGSPITLKS
jgi:flavin-dependent dehydrogenase